MHDKRSIAPVRATTTQATSKQSSSTSWPFLTVSPVFSEQRVYFVAEFTEATWYGPSRDPEEFKK